MQHFSLFGIDVWILFGTNYSINLPGLSYSKTSMEIGSVLKTQPRTLIWRTKPAQSPVNTETTQVRCKYCDCVSAKIVGDTIIVTNHHYGEWHKNDIRISDIGLVRTKNIVPGKPFTWSTRKSSPDTDY